MQKKNGNTNILTEKQEMMRQEIVDLELKARYWKALFETRYYTLESHEIEERYNKHMDDQKAIQAQREKEMEEMLEKLRTQEEIKIEENVEDGNR